MAWPYPVCVLVGAIVFVLLAGAFVTGTSANIPLGAPEAGFMDEDVPVAFSAKARAPMVATATVLAVAPAMLTMQPVVATKGSVRWPAAASADRGRCIHT